MSLGTTMANSRRSYGTGSLYVRKDGNGRESWYGRWRVGDQRLRRLIGPKRQPGSRDGLTRAQAERLLSRQIDSERSSPHLRVTVIEAGSQLISHLSRSLGASRRR